MVSEDYRSYVKILKKMKYATRRLKIYISNYIDRDDPVCGAGFCYLPSDPPLHYRQDVCATVFAHQLYSIINPHSFIIRRMCFVIVCLMLPHRNSLYNFAMRTYVGPILPFFSPPPDKTSSGCITFFVLNSPSQRWTSTFSPSYSFW